MTQKIYSIKFTGAGLDYIRQVLGTRAYDESAGLIQNLDQQRSEQDAAQAVSNPAGPVAAQGDQAPSA